MFDDLRDSAGFNEEDEINLDNLYKEIEPEKKPPIKEREDPGFLGMTAPQRFIIALILLFMVCVLGALCLVITEKVVLPF